MFARLAPLCLRRKRHSTAMASSSTLPRKHLIAVAQTCSTADVENNFRRADAAIVDAAQHGAKLIAFPENFLFLGSGRGIECAQTVSADGQVISHYAALARRHNISVLLGSIPERIPDNPAQVYNTSVLLDDSGRIAASYRKIHLFDLRRPDLTLLESEKAKAGTELVVADTPIGRVALTVCFDLRFPSMYQKLALRGADVFFVPSAWTVPTGSHWLALLTARAIETQAYMVGPAQWGRHSEKRVSFGSSAVVDPFGTVVTRAPERECVIYAEIDLDFVQQVRAQLPVRANHVPGLDKEMDA